MSAHDPARTRPVWIGETTTSAPNTRIVDALSGKRAPDKFMAALSEADEFCREVTDAERLRAENASLRCRVDELEDELVGARESLAVWRDRALAKADVDWGRP